MRLSCRRAALVSFVLVANVLYLVGSGFGPRIGHWDLPRPDSRRIFFHETTGRGDLNARQSCAVESAARHNADRPVHLFLQADRVNESSVFIRVLRRYSNVQVVAFHVGEYFNNTPLNDWYVDGRWKSSPFSREHFSDYIRMLSISKGGGMYMDLDFVTIKPLKLEIFRNFVPVQEGRYLTGSVLHLDHGHRLIGSILSRLAARYRPNEWAAHGPDLVNDIVRKYCRRSCRDLRILPAKFFYPVHYSQWRTYFERGYSEATWRRVNEAHAVHVWNKLSERNAVTKGSDQIYSRLAAEHCPMTYSVAEHNF